jgi:hypothetical protein
VNSGNYVIAYTLPPNTSDVEFAEPETGCRTSGSGPTFAIIRPGLEIRFPHAIASPSSLGDATTTLLGRFFGFIDVLDWISGSGEGV